MKNQRGFTLVELLIVMFMITILVGVSVPAYRQSVVRSKESSLRQELTMLRTAIDNFTFNKNKAPQSLDDLVTAGYIKSVPIDPMTGSDSTWQIDMEGVLLTVDQDEPGITDVHSGASGTALDGTAYSTW